MHLSTVSEHLSRTCYPRTFAPTSSSRVGLGSMLGFVLGLELVSGLVLGWGLRLRGGHKRPWHLSGVTVVWDCTFPKCKLKCPGRGSGRCPREANVLPPLSVTVQSRALSSPANSSFAAQSCALTIPELACYGTAWHEP